MGLHLKCTMTVMSVLALLGGIARADHIVFRDGHTLDGTVTDQDAKTMTVQTDGSATTQPSSQQIDKSQIKSVNGIAHDGPSYVLLPVEGVIGIDISGNAFQTGLEQALQMQPQIIVIFIDSDGGSISELEKMEDALAEVPPGVRKIAYVKKAFSAAAVLAMSCQQIYIKPDGVIGAAVPFKFTDKGLPEDVDAKFRSAFAAKVRTWVGQAGHSDLFVRGMMDLNLQLYIRMEDGQLVISTGGPGRMIKSSGQILTMTAQEATDCGLTQIASKMADIGKQAVGGPWYPESKIPWHTVLDQAAMDKDDLVNSNLDKLNNAIELLRQKIDADQQLIGRLQSKLPVASATRTQDINAEINELNVHISACQSMITQLQDAENQFLSATNSGSTN